MKNFAEYYKDLLERESVEFLELISIWELNLITEIQSDFEQAIRKSDFINSIYPYPAGTTNQALGNKLAGYFTEKLNTTLQVFKIEDCKGRGYPDKILAKENLKEIALELKATSKWDPKDTNRRVLTSSSDKLRKKLNLPIFHLICTVIYQIEDKSAKMLAVRFDFIEPTTEVNIRFEAAVNHKILSSGTHKNIIFDDKSDK
jgi:hypothetical protein